MQVLEFTKKTGLFKKRYGIGITSTLIDEKEVEATFLEVVKVVTQWISMRRSDCGLIQLTVIAPSGIHGAVAKRLRAFGSDEAIAFHLRNLESAKASILDERGRCHEEIDLRK